jgi:hypothetical protein
MKIKRASGARATGWGGRLLTILTELGKPDYAAGPAADFDMEKTAIARMRGSDRGNNSQRRAFCVARRYTGRKRPLALPSRLLIRRMIIQKRFFRAGYRAHTYGAGFRSRPESCSQRTAEIVILLAISANVFVRGIAGRLVHFRHDAIPIMP